LKYLAQITDGKSLAKSSDQTCLIKGVFFVALTSDIFASVQSDIFLQTRFCNPQAGMTAQMPD